MEIKKLYIDGEWVTGSGGKTFQSTNPATGEVLAEIAEASIEDARRAIAAARKSFYETREWRDMDSQARGDIILKIADKLEERSEEFARLDCLDMGKPYREAQADVDDAVHCFRYYASLIKTPHGGCYDVNYGFGEMHSYTVHEPVGVCAEITPWNYPLLMGVWKLAPSIAAGSRIIIEESIKDEFIKRLVKKANAITIGNPMDNPDMGAMVSKSHMEKVLAYIEKGKEEGAKLVCGGERYTEGECAKGYFIRPTVFDECTDDMTIVKEEIFGPVVTVQTFKTEQKAIDMANNTPYGLAGAVFTSDISRAMHVIKEIRAGITWINCYNPTFNEAPWGGYKMSGIGRELGVHGLEEYQEIKQININMKPGTVGWYEH